MTFKVVLLVNIYLISTSYINLSFEHSFNYLELGGDITKIVQDESSDIYVGGANYIAHIPNKFQSVEINLSIGPVHENWNCLPRSTPCDNVVQVLQIIQELGLLLVCGSAYNGTCTLHRLNDLTSWTCIVSDGGDQIVPGHEDNTVITQILSSHPGYPMLEFENNEDTCRPNNFYQFSPLKSNKYKDQILNINTTQNVNDNEDITTRLMIARYIHSTYYVSIHQITYEDMKFYIKLDSDNNSKPKTIRVSESSHRVVNFKMSFLWKQFSYYVTVETSQNSVEITKLNRIPVNSSEIFQLVDIRLQCKHNSTIYNIVTSITLAKVGILSSKGYEAVEGLIATFGSTSNNSSMSTQRNIKNVLCAFPIEDIASFITDELSFNLSNRGEMKISLTEPYENPALFAFNTTIHNIFTYTPVEGNRLMDSVDVYMIDNNSHINKIGLKAIYKQSKPQFENTSQITMISKLDNVSDSWKHYQIGFIDQTKALIYIAHGKKVIQLKTNKCQQFETCNECNTSICRWCPKEKMCVDKMYGEKVCNVATNYFCPPIIDSVRPKELPREGGTLLYLNGSNFGNDSSKISVTLCSRSCHNVTVEDRLITCITGPVCSSTEKCYIQVTKSTNDTNKENFTTPIDCVSPHISSYSPTYGPVSGGIQVHFSGNHLLAGSNVLIAVAGRNCGDIQRNRTNISCQIMKSATNTTICGNVVIKIDNFIKEKKEQFCYKPNPEVNKVQPLASLMRGGTFLNVSGSYINSIKDPQIAINVTNVLNKTFAIFNERCKEPTSNSTVCRTPNITHAVLSLFRSNTLLEYIYGTISLHTGYNHFTPQGNGKIKIFRDPVFNKTRYLLSNLMKKNVLILEGRYIPQWPNKQEWNISVGSFHCPIITTNKNIIECDVSKIQTNNGDPLSSEDTKSKELVNLTYSLNNADILFNLSITVTLGNYKEIVGHVTVDYNKPNGPDALFHISLIGGIMAGLIFVFVILLIITINIRQRRKTFRKRPFYLYGSKIDLQMQPLKEILTTIGDQVKNEDFDKLIISMDKLTIGKPLGSGNFGCVYEGVLQESHDHQPIKVAVKTLKDPKSHNIDLAAFIQEALIMKNFQHSNVLELVGLTEKEPGVPYVILPYMDNGDLLTYVRNSSINLSLHDVIKFGADIASGMAYLSSLKFVHRDLAARNCMLDSCYTVKVADFGLCRDIYEKGYYSSDNKKLLPIRWMSVESIEHGSYSTKSDVWSFGIVLWELLTRGLTPYPGINGWDIINFLRQRRLARPHFCPPMLYKFMTSCWSYKPELRPTFTSLAFDLYAMIGYEQKGQSCPSPIGYNATNKDVPIFKVTSKDNAASLSEGEGYVNEVKPEPEHYYALLESPGTISNTMITIPTCYTLVQVCNFPELNDHQAGLSESTDQSYVQVLDHYDPIKLNAS